MRLTLTGRHIEFTPGLRRLVEQKMVRLDRVLNNKAVSCQVELYMEKFRHVTEVHLHARGGHMFQARVAATSWADSVTEAVDRIAQQGQTLKGKWETRKRAARGEGPVEKSPVRSAPAPKTQRRIVRAKRYAVKPMSLDQAAAAVGPTPDAFVVFRNAETDEVNVVFRRPDGDVGLIEPAS